MSSNLKSPDKGRSYTPPVIRTFTTKELVEALGPAQGNHCSRVGPAAYSLPARTRGERGIGRKR